MRHSPLRKILVISLAVCLLFGALPGSREVTQAASLSLPGDDMACFRGLDTIETRLTDLVNGFPDLAEIVDIGNSWEKEDLGGAEGSDIQVLRLTNESITGIKPKMFVVSGLDSRDILGVELNLRFAERLLEGYGVDPDITMVLDTSEVHLLIVANPDGREELESWFAETPLEQQLFANAWGRNRNLTDCALGVDLTRNFDLDFEDGSDCPNNYAGTSEESEPESKAIAEFLRTLYADLRDAPDSVVDETAPGLVINLTQWDDVPRIVYPYYSDYANPYDPEETKNWIYLLAEKLANVPGTLDYFHVQSGNVNRMQYGSLVDYAYGELGVPALTFRLKKSIYASKFSTCSEFEGSVVNTWTEALMVASRAVPRPFEFGQGPEFVPGLDIEPPTEPFDPVWRITGKSDSRYYQQVPEGLYPSYPLKIYATKLAPAWRPGALGTGPVSLFTTALPHQLEFLAEVPFEQGNGVDKQSVYFQAENLDGKLGIPRAVFLKGPYYLALPVVSK